MHQHHFARIEQLYEYFLIDPGMEPVVQTSRIRLAISSVQLFIQRALLNSVKAAVAGLTLTLKPEHYPFWSTGNLTVVTRADLFAKTTKNSVTIYNPTSASNDSKQGSLVKDSSLGDLRVGQLKKNFIAAPIGSLTLYLDDNTMEDLWLALTWGKES